MKRLLCIFLLLSLLFSLIACQKTPQSPIVIGKDQEIMLERAQQASSTEEGSIPLRERLLCPERVVDEVTLSNGTVSIRIAADVRLPDVDEIPVIRVHAADFSQEIVSMLFDRLCGGAGMMEKPRVSTKSEIEQEIIGYRRALDDPEYADSPNVLEDFEETIAELEAKYPTAPEAIEPVSCTGQLTEIIETYKGVSYRYTGINAYNLDTQSYFMVHNNTDLTEPIYDQYKDAEGNVIVGGGMPLRRSAHVDFSTKESFKNYAQHPLVPILDENAIPAEAEGKLDFTPREARQMAESILAGTDMVVRKIELTDDANLGNYDGKVSPAESYAYRIYCVRQTQGIAQSFLWATAAPNEDNMLAGTWSYEYVQIDIGNDGVFSFDWTSPHTIGDTVVEAAALLPFEEILKIFHKMLPITLDTSYSAYKAVDIEIDQIVLEHQRIVEQNSIENGLLVPVWNFYGTRRNTDEDGTIQIDHNGVFSPQSLFTINAIDGSIIDVYRGY